MRARLPFVVLAASIGLAFGGTPAGAQTRALSSANWGGYAVARTSGGFRRVSGTWVVPAVSCTPGRRSNSAMWVGLGGLSSVSQALEQIGTKADCARNGAARYGAWYELVPDVAHPIRLTIRPGDVIAARVAVSRGRVTLRLSDRTRGTTAAGTLVASSIDVSSAEWIVEAPSLCSGFNLADCVITPLADFGTAAFRHAGVQTSGGHTGSIADPHWTAAAITLDSSSPRLEGVASTAPSTPSGPGATPSALAPGGAAFTVTYTGAGP